MVLAATCQDPGVSAHSTNSDSVDSKRISPRLRARVFRRAPCTPDRRGTAPDLLPRSAGCGEEEIGTPGHVGAVEVAIVKNTTAASPPWNLSTVPTLTPCVCSLLSSRARDRTWSLYGATTMMSSPVSGDSRPFG